LISKIGWGTKKGTKVSFDITVTSVFHHFRIMWLPSKTQLLVEHMKWPMFHKKTVVLNALLWPPP
jgi:hypothetical protein